ACGPGAATNAGQGNDIPRVYPAFKPYKVVSRVDRRKTFHDKCEPGQSVVAESGLRSATPRMPLFGGSDDEDHLRRASHGRPRLCSCVWTGGVLRPKQAIAADARLPMEM